MSNGVDQAFQLRELMEREPRGAAVSREDHPSNLTGPTQADELIRLVRLHLNLTQAEARP